MRFIDHWRACRILLVAVAMLVVAGTGAARADKANQAPGLEATRAAIVQILNSPERLPGHLQRVRDALTAFYVTGDGPVYWVGSGRMSPFIQRLLLADIDGLMPRDYPADFLITLRDTIQPDDPVATAYAELSFSAYLIRYASDLKTGRFIPQQIDPQLFQSRREIDPVEVLSQLAAYTDPTAYLDEFQPHNAHYRALRTQLRKYRAIAEKGGWPEVPSGEVIRPGDRDPRIVQVRQRLAATDDITTATPGAPELFDPALVLAVEQFQKRHGLEADGIIGKGTIAQMNISAGERVRQIVVNMERWRWMPEDMGQRYIMVNIAAFELDRVNSGQIVERIPVMVGQPYHQTPSFSDEMEYIEFNPTWTVPYSIATKEMLPKLQSNPGAYSSEFVVLPENVPVPSAGIDWSQYGRGNFPYTFRQQPGPKNALGRVKFMLPNKFAIYLHDTPSRSLFSRNERAFSHGCIRVYQPIELAKDILAGTPGWNARRIEEVLASNETTRVSLADHIPVHIVYSTVWLGEGGSVEFRPDIYGRDRKLYNALFAKPTS